jgi:hypothetical protein
MPRQARTVQLAVILPAVPAAHLAPHRIALRAGINTKSLSNIKTLIIESLLGIIQWQLTNI